MITVQKHSEDALQLLNSKGKGVGWIYGRYHFPEGEQFPVKSITLDGDKIRVEVERPLSLVEAVGEYFQNVKPDPCWTTGWRELYDAWKREIEKGKP